jgi:hypothetical protein
MRPLLGLHILVCQDVVEAIKLRLPLRLEERLCVTHLTFIPKSASHVGQQCTGYDSSSVLLTTQENWKQITVKINGGFKITSSVLCLTLYYYNKVSLVHHFAASTSLISFPVLAELQLLSST